MERDYSYSELKDYLDYWKKQFQKKDNLLRERKQKLKELAKDCALALKQEFKVDKSFFDRIIVGGA